MQKKNEIKIYKTKINYISCYHAKTINYDNDKKKNDFWSLLNRFILVHSTYFWTIIVVHTLQKLVLIALRFKVRNNHDLPYSRWLIFFFGFCLILFVSDLSRENKNQIKLL